MSLQRHLHGVLVAGMVLVPTLAVHAADPFTLTSTTFKDGQMMPRKVAASTVAPAAQPVLSLSGGLKSCWATSRR